MTNNQLCNLLGCVGCFIGCACLCLMLFGFPTFWGVMAGLAVGALGLVNYD